MTDLQGRRPRFKAHQDPVWREQSDFIVIARISEPGPQVYVEQLYVKRLTDRTFEVCCIPFFLYDVALGDVVHTSPSGTRQHVVDEVVERSGRFVFRVWFKPREPFPPNPVDRRSETRRDLIVDRLLEMGCLMESSLPSLLAVDSPNEMHAQQVANFLAEEERSGDIEYETGRLK